MKEPLKDLEARELAFVDQHAVVLLGLAWRGFLAQGRGAVLVPSDAIGPGATLAPRLVYAPLSETRQLADRDGTRAAFEEENRQQTEYDPETDAVVVFLRQGTGLSVRSIMFERKGLTPREAFERLKPHRDN